MDHIKKEDDSPAPEPAQMPPPYAYETRYSQYTNPPTMQIPQKKGRPSLAANAQYPSEMIPKPYHICSFAPAACMPGYIHYMPDGAMSLRTIAGSQSQPHTSNYKSKERKMKMGTANDLSACHLRTPCTSSSSQGGAGAGAHSSHQPTEEAIQKRELRLMKNREAARECRRKKKEYVRCLENRVAVLENQNKTLIDELRAIKEIYRHE